jgi:hypothetical protein
MSHEITADRLMSTAIGLLDQSPGEPEYIRGMANLIANVTGMDGDLVLEALTAWNEANR